MEELGVYTITKNTPLRNGNISVKVGKPNPAEGNAAAQGAQGAQGAPAPEVVAPAPEVKAPAPEVVPQGSSEGGRRRRTQRSKKQRTQRSKKHRSKKQRTLRNKKSRKQRK